MDGLPQKRKVIKRINTHPCLERKGLGETNGSCDYRSSIHMYTYSQVLLMGYIILAVMESNPIYVSLSALYPSFGLLENSWEKGGGEYRGARGMHRFGFQTLSPGSHSGVLGDLENRHGRRCRSAIKRESHENYGGWSQHPLRIVSCKGRIKLFIDVEMAR